MNWPKDQTFCSFKKPLFFGLFVLFIFSFSPLPSKATTPNLILNPSVETASSNPALPQYWQKGGTGNNTRVLTYPVTGQDGLKAVKTEITSYTDGDAKWYFQNVPVTPGETYMFSDIYTSTTTSHVTFRYQLQNGTFQYPDLQKNIPAAPSWTQFQKTFVVPTTYQSPVQYVTIFHLIKSVGTITTDAYSLNYVDTHAPTASMDALSTEPVSGTISFSATATDNIGVTSVDFKVDGVLVGSASSSPFSISFDTTTISDGQHSVLAVAHDEAGNTSTSSPL